MLVILMVREAALRSMLGARLALSGIDVVSMERVDAARIARLGGEQPVLVADEEAAAQHPGGLVALTADALWHHLVIIGEQAAEDDESHVYRVLPENAASAIATLLRDDGEID